MNLCTRMAQQSMGRSGGTDKASLPRRGRRSGARPWAVLARPASRAAGPDAARTILDSGANGPQVLRLDDGPRKARPEMDVRSAIRRKITEALAPVHLEIVDESQKHRGHAGSRPGGETHFRLEIVSSAFEGKSRLARQRMVHRILADELAGGVHALSLRALTPEERGRA